MLPHFLLISSDNIADVLSYNGIIQLGIIVASIAVVMLALFKFKASEFYKALLLNGPIKAGILASILPSILFFIFAFVSGGIYGYFSNNGALLTLSVSILSLFIGAISVLTFLIDVSMSYDTKHTTLRTTIKIILWLLLIFWVTDFDNILAVHLSKIYINFGTTKISFWYIVSNIFFVFSAIGGVLWAIAVFDNVFIERFTTLENNEKSLIKRVFKIFAGFVGVYVILPTFGVNLTGLSVLGGGLGVGIGLGLQKIASNFISGFIILLDKSVKIGDRVVINGVTGVITEITTRYTVMEAFDGSEVIIPNEQFVTNTIVNQTHSHNDIGLELSISVGYSSDLRLVLELIAECMKEHELINQDKSSSIYIKSFGASGIDIFIRAWPKDALNDMTTIRNDLSIAFLDKLRANNIEIPFPKLDVTLLSN